MKKNIEHFVADGIEYWYLNKKKHRTNGPAVIYINGDKEYWINGKQIRKIKKERKRI